MGLTEEEQAIRDLLNLPGFVITGLKAIGKFMGVSPSAISRWGVRFRGRTETLLCFPLIMFLTGKGLAWTYKTNTSLIAAWMLRWAMIDARERQTGKPRKTITIGEKDGGGRLAREEAGPVHEDPQPEPSTPDCPCGIPSRCKVHLQEEKPTPSLREELAKLGPVERARVINHELTPSQLEELGIKLPETPKTSITRKCTCGTEIECRAHD